MGMAAIALRVSLTGPEVDAEKVKEEISKKLPVKDSKIEPLAFGLKQIRLMITADDKSGVGTDTDKITAEVKKIAGVGDVEVESVTLL